MKPCEPHDQPQARRAVEHGRVIIAACYRVAEVFGETRTLILDHQLSAGRGSREPDPYRALGRGVPQRIGQQVVDDPLHLHWVDIE